ncbi:MAG: protein kinase [Gammaproteobacteria bacterium]|nr:protein kinase [Gammaproteobacteria bacterium]
MTKLIDDPPELDNDPDRTRIKDIDHPDETRIKPAANSRQVNNSAAPASIANSSDTRIRYHDTTRIKPGAALAKPPGAAGSGAGDQSGFPNKETTRIQRRPTGSSSAAGPGVTRAVEKPAQPPANKLPFASPEGETPAIPQARPIQKITLKNRFVLDETLGVGGMGVVYKAIDKRKVEAKDRNPYIAVKILSEDFRHHPDAFIALQREAGKSQRIAHPNIVNVHDFDRDGDTVFMTMEYMEGTPLDKLLRENKGVGLIKEQADRILKDMCAALEHAHKEYVVHADFKPGNVFVTNSGVTKVFDFGIARAVAQADRHSHQGDKSVFDPQTLGALTPAYASPEMLRGTVPTTQDDVFALGCVIYEMYSGEHPFKRIQADQAMEQKLKPKRIKSLTRQQWKALKRTLAFTREERTSSVYEFVWDFTQEKKSPLKNWLTALVILALGAGVYMQYFYKKELSPEEFKAQLEQQIKIDLVKERVGRLLAEPAFTALWESEVWQQVQSARQLLGLKDQWLIQTETEIVGKYLAQISQQRKSSHFNAAQGLLENAGRYRGYEDRLDNERSALNSAIAEMREQQRIREQQRLAKEKQELEQEKARQLAATQARKAQSSKPAATAPETPSAQKAEQKDVFALAMNNVKQQLRCMNDINTRDLEVAVRQARSIDEGKFQLQSRQVISSLTVCIEKIGRTDSNRAEDLKVFALGMFPGDKVISGIRIKPVDPCNMNMAGLGARGIKGTCRDRMTAGGYGPRMVVIPATDNAGPYAIGQYEVSIEQMNEFCRQTGSCGIQNTTNNNLPVTNISFEQAKSYAQWLSKNTGYRYRIPRTSEWLYAAIADHSDLDANRNCSMESRGIKKGETLEEITTGKNNKWGLVNYVGNAQEWVLKNNTDLYAAGGAHTDPIKLCNVDNQRSHDGTPDAVTGFRLVRELRR